MHKNKFQVKIKILNAKIQEGVGRDFFFFFFFWDFLNKTSKPTNYLLKSDIQHCKLNYTSVKKSDKMDYIKLKNV